MLEFKLFISDASAPGRAVTGAPDWTPVHHETKGTGDTIHELAIPAEARFLGIEFLSGDCFYPPPYHHQVSEIEAFTLPPVPDSPDAPSCANTTRTCR